MPFTDIARCLSQEKGGTLHFKAIQAVLKGKAT